MARNNHVLTLNCYRQKKIYTFRSNLVCALALNAILSGHDKPSAVKRDTKQTPSLYAERDRDDRMQKKKCFM